MGINTQKACTSRLTRAGNLNGAFAVRLLAKMVRVSGAVCAAPGGPGAIPAAAGAATAASACNLRSYLCHKALP